MILHLGVIEIPYNEPPPPGKRRKKKVEAGTQTTGDVATFLEDKYHVMEAFFEVHQDDIAKDLEDGLAGTLENLAMGAPPSADPFGAAASAIKARFSAFLESKEMDTLGYPGVPTKASLEGISHRFKNRRGMPGRPSFVDTGAYENAFMAWVD
jgi:hypothetical protein